MSNYITHKERSHLYIYQYEYLQIEKGNIRDECLFLKAETR